MHRTQVSPPLVPLYDEIYLTSQEMFTELNSRNYLRKGLSHGDRKNLKSVWEMTRLIGQTLNYLYTLFDPKNPSRQSQVSSLNGVGMTKDHLTSLWIQSMLMNFLANIESVFRFTLVFFLDTQFFKDAKSQPKYMTASKLLDELSKVCPKARNFNKAYNLDLRNSIAHGAFWFDSGELHFTSDPHFLPGTIRRLSLVRLMEDSMKANVGAMAFLDALDDEINKGTFHP